MHSPLWIRRKLINWQEIYKWLVDAGVKKAIPPEQLHLTLATVRNEVDWTNLELDTSNMIIEPGNKPTQIFAWTIKALTFQDESLERRHKELLDIFPDMDHPNYRSHISLYKGGRMPTMEYTGRLLLGPEEASEFNPDNSMGIKHLKVRDTLENGHNF